MEKIIISIEKICFNFDCSLNRRKIHKEVIISIKRYLESVGFNVILEYPIKFENVKRKYQTASIRNGYIDLVGIKDNIKIGIEIDTGTHTKFKSIEKLIKGNFLVSFAIVKGDSRNHNLIQENIDKIHSIKNRSFEKIILIVMDNKSTNIVITKNQQNSATGNLTV